MSKLSQVFKMILLSCLLAGCACLKDIDTTVANENDPLEPMNRAVFSFNDTMDTYLMRPIADGYRWLVPKFIRTSVSNVFETLSQPAHFANALLQGQFKDAGSVLGRTGVNLTFGLLGLFDVASEMGIPDPQNDFGQTLAKWGWETGGPFVMLPLLGPSNVRDTIGMGVDATADVYYWRFKHEEAMVYGEYAVDGLQTREKMLDLMDNMKSSSTDYYAAMRTMYRQNRQKKINQVLPQNPEAEQAYDFDFEIEEE
jgi:phospholipid-binding lipoprotein MlaA